MGGGLLCSMIVMVMEIVDYVCLFWVLYGE